MPLWGIICDAFPGRNRTVQAGVVVESGGRKRRGVVHRDVSLFKALSYHERPLRFEGNGRKEERKAKNKNKGKKNRRLMLMMMALCLRVAPSSGPGDSLPGAKNRIFNREKYRAFATCSHHTSHSTSYFVRNTSQSASASSISPCLTSAQVLDQPSYVPAYFTCHT
ncbi:hypothetical protein SODALDRAFT_71299 [Sodiomyces alkalinus F11]|uniref:Uncharacterized protein n=1 Tax=Sodiomyces alkalinus (strain CBS 110278 / VKM F-3762 / F11) TaxID=1314773 RepID=A0A3N2PMJ5_SODAK|nr:hypothetical protein SODALDRAFT_71299 [Sodiomyces alkalinus F11]ROT35634.1 hypothetical protein SODALDRAFT_71299 [Sodiomyces alkalinus F11]